MTELVPSCHRTRSGFAATTALSKRLSMSSTSSPPTPRLSTVIEWVWKSRLSSTASWLGYVLAGELAPAPAVDDEPMATMVIGAPAVSFCATCDSGLARRIRSSGVSHDSAGVSARDDNGNAKVANSAATVVHFIARQARLIPCTAVSSTLTNGRLWRAARLAWPPRSRNQPAIALCKYKHARPCQVFSWLNTNRTSQDRPKAS